MAGIDQAALNEALESGKKAAEKDPASRINDLMVHAGGVLGKHQADCEKRLAAMQNGGKDDPYAANFKVANELFTELHRKLLPKNGKSMEFDPNILNDPGGEIKGLVNAIWVRTLLPDRHIRSHAADEAGNMGFVFDTPGKGPSSMVIMKNGVVKITEDNGEKSAIVPPFPGSPVTLNL